MLRTEFLKLPYVEPGEFVTHAMERERYEIIDTQLATLFRIFGNGVIWGLEILNTPPPFLSSLVSQNPLQAYLSPGACVINHLGCEFLTWSTITEIVAPNSPDITVTNYVLAVIDEGSARASSARLVCVQSQIEIDRYARNALLLGRIIVSYDPNAKKPYTLTIDQNNIRRIGLASFITLATAQHRHGQDGLAPIDLTTDVTGKLDKNLLSLLPTSALVGPPISPQFIRNISHNTLLDSGIVTHEELDEIVRALNAYDQRLLGELSLYNLLQAVLQAKKVFVNIDEKLTNIISCLIGKPYLDYEGSTQGILDPITIKPINYINENSYQLHDSSAIYPRNDACIVDYDRRYIYSQFSSIRSSHFFSISGSSILASLAQNKQYLHTAKNVQNHQTFLSLYTQNVITPLFDSSQQSIVYINNSTTLPPNPLWNTLYELWAEEQPQPVPGTVTPPIAKNLKLCLLTNPTTFSWSYIDKLSILLSYHQEITLSIGPTRWLFGYFVRNTHGSLTLKQTNYDIFQEKTLIKLSFPNPLPEPPEIPRATYTLTINNLLALIAPEDVPSVCGLAFIAQTTQIPITQTIDLVPWDTFIKTIYVTSSTIQAEETNPHFINLTSYNKVQFDNLVFDGELPTGTKIDIYLYTINEFIGENEARSLIFSQIPMLISLTPENTTTPIPLTQLEDIYYVGIILKFIPSTYGTTPTLYGLRFNFTFEGSIAQIQITRQGIIESSYLNPIRANVDVNPLTQTITLNYGGGIGFVNDIIFSTDEEYTLSQGLVLRRYLYKVEQPSWWLHTPFNITLTDPYTRILLTDDHYIVFNTYDAIFFARRASSPSFKLVQPIFVVAAPPVTNDNDNILSFVAYYHDGVISLVATSGTFTDDVLNNSNISRWAFVGAGRYRPLYTYYPSLASFSSSISLKRNRRGKGSVVTIQCSDALKTTIQNGLSKNALDTLSIKINSNNTMSLELIQAPIILTEELCGIITDFTLWTHNPTTTINPNTYILITQKKDNNATTTPKHLTAIQLNGKTTFNNFNINTTIPQNYFASSIYANQFSMLLAVSSNTNNITQTAFVAFGVDGDVSNVFTIYENYSNKITISALGRLQAKTPNDENRILYYVPTKNEVYMINLFGAFHIERLATECTIYSIYDSYVAVAL